MKPLEIEFIGRGEVKGFKFRQISATDRAFLYEVSPTNTNVHYEVFKLKINKRFNCISYPTSKAFGVYAWSYMSFERAKKKFDKLNKEG